MSLFSSLGQRLFDGARELFNQPQPPVDGQQQPGTLQRFGIFNFSGNKTALSDEMMRSLSASIPSDAGANAQLETAHLAATTQTGSKTWRWGEGANKNGYIVTVTPKEVGLERWGTVDPKIVTARAME